MIKSIYHIIKSWNKFPKNIFYQKIAQLPAKTIKSSAELKLNEIVQSKMHDQMLSRREAAEFLGVKENTLAIWKLTNRQIIPTYKVGKFIKYKASDLQKFIDNSLL